MTVFNLLTNKFETYNKQKKFLTLQIDRDRSDLAEIIHFVDKNNEEFLALNNEDDENLEECLKLFKGENKRFILFLDFYRKVNVVKLLNILKTK